MIEKLLAVSFSHFDIFYVTAITPGGARMCVSPVGALPQPKTTSKKCDGFTRGPRFGQWVLILNAKKSRSKHAHDPTARR